MSTADTSSQISQPPPHEHPDDAKADERVTESPRWRQALIRPELGASCGVILVFILFFSIAQTVF